jgi:hypothetical protein
MSATPVQAPVGAGLALLHRERSILQFNRRVLAQASRTDLPLLERLRYVTIVSSNLDEFFEVRMADLVETARPLLVRHTVGLAGDLTIREAVMPDNQVIAANTSTWPAAGWHPRGWVLNFGLWWSPIAEPARFPPAEDSDDAKAWAARVKAVYASALPGLDKLTTDEWKSVWAAKEADRKVRQEAEAEAKRKAAAAIQATQMKKLAAAGIGRASSPSA